jgi:hypothetical protein
MHMLKINTYRKFSDLIEVPYSYPISVHTDFCCFKSFVKPKKGKN